MSRRELLTLVQRRLIRRQLPSGGWSFFGSRQEAIEPSCLAALALRSDNPTAAELAGRRLLETQKPNGSWPAFVGDDSEGCWVTSLAVATLESLGHQSPAIERAQRWLVNARGHESHWLWRWKFRTLDTKVHLDPDKFGWPWIPETPSWVIPTAFALLALKRSFRTPRPEDVAFRIRRGTEMLLDRACPAGGWNAGNGVAFGVALAPHLDATAIALLAIQDEKPNEVITRGLDWLRREVVPCSSPFSLSWAVVALTTYQKQGAVSLRDLRDKTRLEASLVEPNQISDCSTLGVAALALEAIHGVNAFAVDV